MVEALVYPAVPGAPMLVRTLALARMLASDDPLPLDERAAALADGTIGEDRWWQMRERADAAAYDIVRSW
jgi:hypothetical protein